MITAKNAREKSIKSQLNLVVSYIKTAIEDNGFKSICISDDLNESMYDEVVQELLSNGFDIIFKKYTERVDEIISWENGKETNGSLISLDCRLMDTDEILTYFIDDEFDDSNYD